jgi:hypothetical protein
MSQFIWKKISRRMSALVLAGIIAMMTVVVAEDRPDSFDWKGQIAAGNAIEIKGVNGSIKAETAKGTQVEIQARKRGKNSNPADVQIKVVEHSGGVTICAVYPTPAGNPPNECKPGSGGRMNVSNNDVQVEFTVKVPAGVHFLGRTVNGGIDANALPGDIEAYAVNGSIQISGYGAAKAETVNGGINASLGAGSLGKSLIFKTVNGGIDVSVPAGVNAEMDIQTVNGNIHTDFPLTIQGRINPKQLRGKIGNGGATIKLETVNGSINLRRSS